MHYHGHHEFADQDEFNQAVSRALSGLYRVAIIAPDTIAAGEPDAEAIATQDDLDLRAELERIQAFAFRADLVPV